MLVILFVISIVVLITLVSAFVIWIMGRREGVSFWDALMMVMESNSKC